MRKAVRTRVPRRALMPGSRSMLTIAQPSLAAQIDLQLLVVARDGRQPGGDALARPPCGRAARRETIAIELDADVARRRAAERIASRAAPAPPGRPRSSFQTQVHRPRVVARARPSPRTRAASRGDSGTGSSSTGRRAGSPGWHFHSYARHVVAGVISASVVPSNTSCVALAADAAERAVGVDQRQARERRVHHLLARQQVHDRTDAEQRDRDAQRRDGGALRARRRRRRPAPVRRARRAARQHAPPQAVVEAGERSAPASAS